DEKQTLDVRARSYLHSNCSHCHMKWGGGNAEFKLLATLPLNEMGVVNVKPAHGDFGINGAKLLVPGHPEQSIILNRMERTGLGRLPQLGSHVPEEKAVRLVREWIKELKGARRSPGERNKFVRGIDMRWLSLAVALGGALAAAAAGAQPGPAGNAIVPRQDL